MIAIAVIDILHCFARQIELFVEQLLDSFFGEKGHRKLETFTNDS